MKGFIPCVVYHTAPGQPNLQLGLGCPPDIVRFECVTFDAFSALRKCMELESKYAPFPQHMSGYHYVSGPQWCEYWRSVSSSGVQLSFGD